MGSNRVMHEDDIEAVLGFWLGEPGEDGASRGRRWFASDPATDEAIRERFGHLVEAASAGRLPDWKSSARGRLALVILIDQFRRNLYRGTPGAFAEDGRALDICLASIEDGSLEALPPLGQAFMLMPLQHAESRAVQARSVKEFDRLRKRVEASSPEDAEAVRGFANYARQHRDIVERFGRYPHRNAILGRDSTPEEENYLAGDAPSFGQTARPGDQHEEERP